MKTNKSFKKGAAVAALIVIAFMFLLLIYGAAAHDRGILLLALFGVIVLPAVAWLILAFLRLARGKETPEEETEEK